MVGAGKSHYGGNGGGYVRSYNVERKMLEKDREVRMHMKSRRNV